MLNPFRRLYKQPLLRRLLLPLFAKINLGDISIRHHYTNQPLRLHSYRHKGYWFHGRRREGETMEFFRKAIDPGDTVLEVGGHVGYMTMYFSQLAGSKGNVVVFEPGSNNLPYIRQNTQQLSNVALIEKAVSDEDGVANFYEEELTGQNNSLHREYDIFRINRERAYSNTDYNQRQVETVKLDTYEQSTKIKPGLIKIDIEGAELLALQGGQKMITKHLPILMVEVTDKKESVFNLLKEWGYTLYSDTGRILQDAQQLDFNVCALRQDVHAEVLDRCGWTQSAAAA